MAFSSYHHFSVSPGGKEQNVFDFRGKKLPEQEPRARVEYQGLEYRLGPDGYRWTSPSGLEVTDLAVINTLNVLHNRQGDRRPLR